MDFYELFMLVIPLVESYNALEVGIPTYDPLSTLNEKVFSEKLVFRLGDHGK